jgi:hypothetical protein
MNMNVIDNLPPNHSSVKAHVYNKLSNANAMSIDTILWIYRFQAKRSRYDRIPKSAFCKV